LKLLVIGAGGREHALARRLERDPEISEVLLAPGNEGAAARFRCLPIEESDPAALIAACGEERVSFAVVGPEAPLAAGVADALREAGIATFGPARDAARLESSKWFAKQLMAEAGVPTARAERHLDLTEAIAALARFDAPWVLKADGLAAGKGVCVTPDREAAEMFLTACLESGRFGTSGRTVLVEEFLAGEEASVMAVCDGTRHVLLPSARDYKRARDGDRGPNTGGMGAYAPAGHVSDGVESMVSNQVVTPILEELARRGVPFRGLLYCGLMIGVGGPRVVEFNVRFGDPETQVVLPLVGGSLFALLASAARGELESGAVRREPGAAVAVALVDEGYPEEVRGGGRIVGLEAIESDAVGVIHAGTTRRDGEWTVKGGRAAYVVAQGRNLEDARSAAYRAVDRLSGDGWRCRHDIAAAAEARGNPAPAAAGTRRAGG